MSEATANTSALQATPPAITEEIAEKYHVKNEAGEFDLDKSARAVAKAHRELERRVGAVGFAPESVDKYDLKEVGEGADELVKSEGVKKFLAKAHAAGMTNKQAVTALQSFMEVAPTIAKGAEVMTEENGRAAMQVAWPDAKVFEQNVGAGLRAVDAVAQKAGVDPDDVHGSYTVEINGKPVTFPPLANHPLFGRLMAALGSEIGEAKPPQSMSQADAQTWTEQVAALKAHPAYNDERHAEHTTVRTKVRAMYEKRYPETAN
jgi:hypothetical protein